MIKKETLHPKNNVQDDIYPKTSTDQVEGLSTALALKANASDVETALALKANTNDVASALGYKADKSDTYTKEQVDNALALKQDKLIAGTGITIGEDGKTISATASDTPRYKHSVEFWYVENRSGWEITGKNVLIRFEIISTKETAFSNFADFLSELIKYKPNTGNAKFNGFANYVNGTTSTTGIVNYFQIFVSSDGTITFYIGWYTFSSGNNSIQPFTSLQISSHIYVGTFKDDVCPFGL